MEDNHGAGMKFTLSWLREYLNVDAPLADLVEAMTMAGLEVEEVEDPAAALADFTIAHVLEAKPHPDADRLRVCRVATKDGEKQIVCGAPNARTGLIGAYAPLGTYIPGLDFALDAKPRKIRGVESHGMLCSAKELQAGDDHDGILDFKGDWAIGAPVADVLGLNDPVIDFEVTPNRPDWLGVVGIARDLAACGLGSFKAPKSVTVKGKGPCSVPIRVDAKSGCPAFAGRVIRGVKNGPSPDWMQARLRAVGIGPKNMLVDVTNYLSLDRARPLHVYDVAKLSGGIEARLGRKGESFLALDGKEYEVTEDMCVIADEVRVLGLGGVMGGEYSGVTEATTDVFIESAWFDPDRTARTGRATGITSDAQYRFARGVDPQSLVPGLEAATKLIMDVCGGEASNVEFAGEAPTANPAFAFDPDDVRRLTGLNLRKAKIVSMLKRLGMEVGDEDDKGRLTVSAPSWRPDVSQSADLVEEAARLAGYDELPAEPLPRTSGRRAPAMSPVRRRQNEVRRTLAARGLHEVITWSFCRDDEAKLFGAKKLVSLANPISSELTVMRPSALAHLCAAIQKSADRGLAQKAFFEVGPVYHGATERDQTMLAALVRSADTTRHWAGVIKDDVFAIKADVMAALEAAGAPVTNVQVKAGGPDWYHPGRSGVIQLGPKVRLAEFGELHPRVLKALGVEGRVLAAEINLDAIPAPKEKPTRTKPALQASDLMPLRRDFAFVADAATPAGDIVSAAAGADKALIADVRVFDVFEGASLGDDKKSVALEVTLQPRDKTLDEKAIEAVSNAVVSAVAKKTGATLRG